eukprot:TRINITY_DN1408_c0_g1_i2.p1 TRINITY_DN1408_c0_g1~~TRINITY_DN1408_c0_g1_i2.p1  ORF type:complete len:106 (-),score=31.76 TRINITY_DN1408_c0_g1_i2:22-339(-)
MSTSSFHQKYLDNNKSIPDIQQRVPLSDAEIWGVVEHIPSTGAKIRTAMFVAGGAGTLYVLSKGLFMMGTNQKGLQLNSYIFEDPLMQKKKYVPNKFIFYFFFFF